jgi:IS30 family transposase
MSHVSGRKGRKIRMRYWKLPPDIRREVIRLAARGATYNEIIGQLDMSVGAVANVLRPLGGVYRSPRPPSPHRLSLDDRVEIQLGLGQRETYQQIAERIGRNKSSVWREVNRNGGRDAYKAMNAHRAADVLARRPKPTKLASNPRLRHRVIRDLEALWSPQQIAERLRQDFGEDVTMHISHETIYRSLYVQGRGELRKELHRCLRTGRATRKRQGRGVQGARISNMVSISERPAEADDRAVPGHWEGDLIIGKLNRSQIGTLVERTTRFVLLLHLPNGGNAEAVRDAMAAKITELPEQLRRSITWDQGKEMAEHASFTVATGVPVYFCDPHSPWQRGSNENTNGLLRQWFPKGTDLSDVTAADLDRVAELLNGRPRQTLDWHTPAEKLTELVATTG